MPLVAAGALAGARDAASGSNGDLLLIRLPALPLVAAGALAGAPGLNAEWPLLSCSPRDALGVGLSIF